MRARIAPLHRLLYAKYYIDELYEALIGRPLLWVSDRIFLRLGDRLLIDGTLNGLAALAQRTAGRLARVQTGSLNLYVLFVLLGIVGALVWSWRHG
jgi:NADH-quinone oxidoreductase subunit L